MCGNLNILWHCHATLPARKFRYDLNQILYDYTVEEMRIPCHLTCFLTNLYVGQEATVSAGHGTTDWFKLGKGVHQGCILLPCLFNLNAKYILRNAWLHESQARTKISGRISIISDMQIMAKSKEESNSLLMKMKEEN